MSLSCPLCTQNDIQILEVLSDKELIRVYKEHLECDISNELLGVYEIIFFLCHKCDLRFFSPPIVGSKAFYEFLQSYQWYYQEEKAEFDFARGILDGKNRVLEIGAGEGAFSKIINVKYYVGLEPYLPSSIKLSNRSNHYISNETLEVHANKYYEHYDSVCAFQVLEHVSNPALFIENSIRCLKPGGLLIYSVPSADSFVSTITNNSLNLPPHHVTWWTDKCFRKIAPLFDLDLITIHHEPLDIIHHEWYVTHSFIEKSRKLFGYRFRLIDFTWKYMLIRKVAVLCSKLIISRLKNNIHGDYGHSVTIVYQKRDNGNT